MRKKIGILLLCFFLSLIFFQVILNREDEDTIVQMSEASLPVITIDANECTMGELHGYVTPMDACYMRDAIIPLTKDRKMDATIYTNGYEVKHISYELRSLNTERKIAETKLEDWSLEGNQIRASLQIENLVDKGEEYLLVLIISGDEQDIYYYTRVTVTDGEVEKECLAFAKYFHDTAMSENYKDLSKYLEVSEYSDKDTLAKVGIDASVNQVGWQGFDGQMIGDAVISITDISDAYISLIYSYQMESQQNGLPIYYNVEEYFKIRYTAEQIYLLDYQRDMEQILQEGGVSIKNNILDLGITGSDIEYLSNETGTIVSFVQAGELFEYNQNKKILTKVFGFIDDPQDVRQKYQEHTIRILNIDETGSMDFVVYGYMNRGQHEGECGIDLYHYDSAKSEASEQVFISSTHSFQILDANFSDLLYENAKGDFYIMMGGTLAKVGLDDLSTKDMMKGLRTDQYAVSTSGQYVAWISEGQMADTISVIDLETEKIRTIEAAQGTKIKPLEFMTEDLVYGIAWEKDITEDAVGTTIYPMKQVKIVNTLSEDFKELKTYEKEGYFVTELQKEGFTLYLQRVTLENGSYVDALQDTIKDSAGEQHKVVEVTSNKSGKHASTIQIVMAAMNEDEKISTVAERKAQLAVAPKAKSIAVSVSDQEETYFVYFGNRVILTTQNITRAIQQADEQMGLVVDNKQNYIWKRGKNAYVNAFADVEVGSLDANANSSAGAISAMLTRKGENGEVHSQLEQGESPLSILEKSLKDMLVLDLTGCNLNQVLYYVSQGTPVYARTGQGEAVLLIGYDAANVIIYEPTADRYRKMASDDANKLFEQNGNVFISYVE